MTKTLNLFRDPKTWSDSASEQLEVLEPLVSLNEDGTAKVQPKASGEYKWEDCLVDFPVNWLN